MEQHSQRKSLFSNNFQKTNLVIGGCVRTTHPDIFFAGVRRIHYNTLIEIPLLVMTIAAGEFCHQQCLHNQQRGSKHKFPRISLTKHWLLPFKPGSSLGVPQRGNSLMEGVSMMGLMKWILEPGYFFAHL